MSADERRVSANRHCPDNPNGGEHHLSDSLGKCLWCGARFGPGPPWRDWVSPVDVERGWNDAPWTCVECDLPAATCDCVDGPTRAVYGRSPFQ